MRGLCFFRDLRFVKRRLLFFALPALLFSTNAFSGTLQDTVYLNRDTFTLYQNLFRYCAFNASPAFSRTNAMLYLPAGDTLQLSVVNNDIQPHTLTIDNVLSTGNQVLPGDTQTFTLSFSQAGTYRFYSALSNGAQLGASGSILAGYENTRRFTWNLFDQDTVSANAFHNQTISSVTPAYSPDVFLINGVSYPQTSMDSTTTISGAVNDSIIIAVVNSGHMSHALHFHGYHVRILSSDRTPQMNGWLKDSFPVKPGGAMTLLLIPDKPGMYPVHDHNLICVTNNGLYAGGMMTMIDITP